MKSSLLPIVNAPLSSDYPPVRRGTIVVWGMLASSPFGGMTWQVLHHLAGVRRLGFDVWYVEDSDTPVYNPTTYCQTSDYDDNVAYLSRQMARLNLADRWIFRPPGVYDTCLGARDPAGLRSLYKEADAVLNLCGDHKLRPEHKDIRCLVYLETDPVANQVGVANGDVETIQELALYNYIFTYGTNLGAPDCLVPIERFTWLPTRPPVCCDWWSTDARPSPRSVLTTVGNWKHNKDIIWKGEPYYWSKHYEFLRFINLPLHSALPLELTIGAISEEDLTRMRRHGWRLVPSVKLADPEAYRDYIRSSMGEFTVAKDQNIRLRSGWFSDRSVCYLAAGRPVITQDTAFGNHIPTGEGLFAFSTQDEAVAAIETIAADYGRHSAAASQIAKEFFAAERVLGDIFQKIGIL